MTQKHSKYFEGILQLRNPSKEILAYINNAEDSAETPMISEIKKVRNGFDAYFVSNNMLLAFGKRLQEKFGGELKTSARLHTRSKLTSKDVYRVSVLLRLPYYNVGDIVEIKGELYKVTTIGRKIFAKSIETGKKVAFRYDEMPK